MLKKIKIYPVNQTLFDIVNFDNITLWTIYLSITYYPLLLLLLLFYIVNITIICK